MEETERQLNDETPLLKMNCPNHQKERYLVHLNHNTLLYVNIFDF